MTGKELEIARQMMGLSRSELAARLGIHYSSLHNWESNGAAKDELKPWVPLALAGLKPESFKIIDGEIFIRLQSSPDMDAVQPPQPRFDREHAPN